MKPSAITHIAILNAIMRRPPDNFVHVLDPGLEENIVSRMLPSLAKRGADYGGDGMKHTEHGSQESRDILRLSSFCIPPLSKTPQYRLLRSLLQRRCPFILYAR